MHDPSHSVGVLHGRIGSGLPQFCPHGLSVLLEYLIPSLSHQEGIIPQPKLSRPTEHCNKVSCDDTVSCPVVSSGLSRVRESDTSLLDWHTGDRSPGDLECGTLK